MPSTQGYLKFIQDQLSGLEQITWRSMMGEYILYYRGKVVGGIYDDRLLVKPVKSVIELLPEAPMELPYEGAKPMLLVEDVENREQLSMLMDRLYEALPALKRKKTR